MNRPLASLAFAALISTAATALALPPAPKNEAQSAEVDRARTHFLRGAELYGEGNFDAALAEFTRAYELVPNYRVLYNIAQVQVERHDYVAARRAFSDYLRMGAADIPQERREELDLELASLMARISDLMVTSNVAGAEVSIDGVPAGTLPLTAPLQVSAGTRRISLAKRGYTPAERTISVAGGDKPELSLKLEPLNLSSVDPSARPSSPVERSRPLGAGVWVSLLSTGVFASSAVVFGVLAQNENDKLEKELGRYPADRTRVEDVRSRLRLYAGLTDGSAAAAGVSAVLAVYFIVSNSSRAERPAASSSATRVVPLANGVALAGRF
jgi:hypothetical protein